MIKELIENIALAKKLIGDFLVVASSSTKRVLIVVGFFGVSIIAFPYFYLNYLLSESNKISEDRNKEIIFLGDELGYKVALDAVTSCIESDKSEPNVKARYCNEAIDLYKKVSINKPQERVHDVISRQAFLSMRNDVSHYVRTIELDRLSNLRAPRKVEFLNSLFARVTPWMVAISVAALMLFLYLFIRLAGKRKMEARQLALFRLSIDDLLTEG